MKAKTSGSLSEFYPSAAKQDVQITKKTVQSKPTLPITLSSPTESKGVNVSRMFMAWRVGHP